ncbi:hypothetical protein AVEN_137216-1 [Araneus ventricosus]|uniref:Uncharacterized protein n=1 Tax=Araneus ventricosus TaxID=182803 RepID=A0A4Y2IUT5_ARAVE|nr:hypothetical protein AVEN_137216-1 [Araneus ventricosus]
MVSRKVCYRFHFKVLFTDEASFTKEGIFNTHNAHFRAVGTSAAQSRLRLMFGPALWGSPHRTLPVAFSSNSSNYLIFLQQVFPNLLGGEQISTSM